MGNTWNHYGCNINDTVIMEAADAIIKLGLKDLGYKYVNIDDCWMASRRSASGELVPDPVRFPRGIRPLADYMHQAGLKLGIYSSAGSLTCQRLPASLDHEDIDARTWASWGIDYLKYDNCYHDTRPAKERYARMRNALNNTGRRIFFSICNWGEERLYEKGSQFGNSWRTTYDISNNFESVRSIFRENAALAKFAGVGGWNDPDMLEVGNNALTPQEAMTHFALWAMAKSPLLIGCDLSKISATDLKILKNKEIIAINQDSKGEQAICALHCEAGDYSGSSKWPQVFKTKLENGDYALSITNWNDKISLTNQPIRFKEVGLPGNKYRVRDLSKGQDIGDVLDEVVISRLEVHDTAVLRLHPLS